MLGFSSKLEISSKVFAIFVNEKFSYVDKRYGLSNSIISKIRSFLKTLKAKNDKEEIYSFDVSEQSKFIVIKVKDQFDNSYTEELGGRFLTFVQKNKNIERVDVIVDSLFNDKNKTINFSAQFINGYHLKNYSYKK